MNVVLFIEGYWVSPFCFVELGQGSVLVGGQEVVHVFMTELIQQVVEVKRIEFVFGDTSVVWIIEQHHRKVVSHQSCHSRYLVLVLLSIATNSKHNLLKLGIFLHLESNLMELVFKLDMLWKPFFSEEKDNRVLVNKSMEVILLRESEHIWHGLPHDPKL